MTTAVDCPHLGADTGMLAPCAEGCRGVKLKVFECAVFGQCTIAKQGEGIQGCCSGKPIAGGARTPCPRYTRITWSYGVTTVPSRRIDLLPRTLQSLAAAGFPEPRLFIDGARERDFPYLGYKCSYRWPALRTHGNWFMALQELYQRNSDTTYYAVFQDDLEMAPNTRQYLEQCAYPERGYWNLYTFPENQEKVPAAGATGRQQIGWCRSNQRGLGALALVFNRAAVVDLLTSRHMVERSQDKRRGWKAVDGGIVSGMRKAGRFEYIHNPSLVQHIGVKSTMGNGKHAQASSYRGTDAMALLEERMHN